MRTFIAIPLSDLVLHSLGQTQATLKNKIGNSVTWTALSSIHLTLKFLGEIPEKQIPDVSVQLDIICKTFEPFNISFGGLGCFPNTRSPRVIWAGIETNEQLIKLQTEIEGACNSLGFPKEERRFSPHLTLGRVKFDLTKEQLDFLGSMAREENNREKLKFSVEQVNFYKSDLQQSGAKYTILRRALFNP